MRKRDFEAERLRQARDTFQRDVVAPLWAEAERKALALAADDWAAYVAGKAADRELLRARNALARALRAHRATGRDTSGLRARLKAGGDWPTRS